MAIELKMPALSPTMEKGTLAKWLVSEGDIVKPGVGIAEIETDKATMEFEADEEGRISKLLVAEGSEDVPVGTIIALLAEPGEAVAGAETAKAAPVAAEAVATPTPEPAVTAAPAPPVAPTLPVADVGNGGDDGINATPLARRIARASGLSLRGISGTGARGRITKADLGLPPSAPSPMPTPLIGAAAAVAPIQNLAPPVGIPVASVKLSGMRKTIARRLTEAKQTVPHFYLTARCRLDALLKLRSELNHSVADSGTKLSVNDMLIRAMGLALVEVPDANVQFGGEELHRFGRVDIAMAVAIPGGLVTPVIKDVTDLSLSAIARQSKALASKAREGKLVPEDYQGGTAAISNLGMYGIDEMVPVINPPQALILGIGAGVEQPWKVDGQIALATIMAATGSFDHRAIDGAVAAQFMAAFRDLVEKPLRILA